jgi:hypothetical protein
MKQRISFVWIVLLAAFLLPRPAGAAFHLMEIEQVIGGVGGDTTAQAVQLKMRFGGQNLLAGAAQVVVRDAAGANPLVIATFPLPNPPSNACREILLATNGFAAKTSPAAVRDYVLTQIPAGYLPAGSLTFESFGGGGVWWRVSWGGGGYTGAHNVISVAGGGNDDDGTAAPAFGSALPSTTGQALRFNAACPTASSTNAAQYAATAGNSTFTNNTPANFVVQFTPPPAIPGLPGAAKLLLPAALGLAAIAFAVLRRRSA